MDEFKPGARVVAVRDANDEEINIFGRGVYEGEFDAPIAITAEEWAELKEGLGELHITNPRIRLDSGDVVWGMQCWWGDEETFDKWIEGRKVNVVPVEPLDPPPAGQA